MNKNILLILRLIISAVFIISALTKLIAPGLFEISIIEQGIFAERESVAYLARMIIGLELCIGFLYLQPYYLKKIISPITIFVLLVFSSHLIYLITIGNNDNCGCFGEIIKMSPIESLIKNILIFIPVIIIYIKSESLQKNFYVPILIAVFSFVVVFIIEPVKNIRDFQFAKFTRFENEGRVDLSDGEKLVAVFNLECDHCQATSTLLQKMINENKNIPPVYILFFGEGYTSVEEFFDISKSHFPYRMITQNEFFDLIGNSPPRIYYLKDGEIIEYWDNDFEQKIINAFNK